MSQMIESLRWKKFPVLNDGFVCLVDVMGDDAAVVQAARVSYGNDERKWDCNEMGGPPSPHDSEDKIQQELRDYNQKKDRDLLRYLMRHRHTTPFEMAEIKLLVRVPMDTWRQWIRHRTANVNEYSTRYTEAIDSQQTTLPGEWRLQNKDNKQGSSGLLVDEVAVPNDLRGTISGQREAEALSAGEAVLHAEIRGEYERRLKAGVAKEQARKDLPLSTYTEAYWKIDLHNLLHFLGLRMDSHAQKEIRDYATIIGEQIVKPLFPTVWEAFEDYRLGAMFLSRLDIEVIKRCQEPCTWEDPEAILEEVAEVISNDREQKECIAKLKRMGMIP